MSRFSVDISGLDEVRQALINEPENYRRAGIRAVNKGARQGRTMASRKIRQQVGLKAAYVNTKLTRDLAFDKKPEAEIVASHEPVLLTRFGAVQLYGRGKTVERKRFGISLKIKAGGPRVKQRSFFFIRLKTGANAVAVRTGPNPEDYEIKYGPSVDQVFKTVRQDIEEPVLDIVEQEFSRQLILLRK